MIKYLNHYFGKQSVMFFAIGLLGLILIICLGFFVAEDNKKTIAKHDERCKQMLADGYTHYQTVAKERLLVHLYKKGNSIIELHRYC